MLQLWILLIGCDEAEPPADKAPPPTVAVCPPEGCSAPPANTDTGTDTGTDTSAEVRVLTEDLVLRQPEVEAFCGDRPVILDGTDAGAAVTIGPMTTLTRPLSCLVEVRTGGGFFITGTSVFDLRGLENLSAVVGDMTISSNSELASLDGLEGLQAVTGALSIYYNFDLSSVAGLSGLESVGRFFLRSGEVSSLPLPSLHTVSGELALQDIPITSLEGLGRLDSIGLLTLHDLHVLENINALTEAQVGGLTVNEAHQLSSISGMSGNTTLGTLTITQAPALRSLSGLESVTGILGDIGISGNPALTDISALSGLTELSGALDISKNNLLESLEGLHNVTRAAQQITISSNNELAALRLDSLEHAKSRIYINDNSHLQSLEGLEALRTVSYFVELKDNRELIDITSLHTITSIGGDLTITGNARLTAASVQALVEAIGEDNIGGEIVTD